MRRKSNLSLELFGDRLPAMQGSGGEPDAEYRKMLRALHAAMEGELTQRQRECIQLRYFEQMRVNEIAGLLGLTPGTVSVHIKKGRERLGKVMRYSFSRLEPAYLEWGRAGGESSSRVSPGFRQRIFARMRGCFRRWRTILPKACPPWYPWITMTSVTLAGRRDKNCSSFRLASAVVRPCRLISTVVLRGF